MSPAFAPRVVRWFIATEFPKHRCRRGEVLEARGSVVYAKSNTPEFGSGGYTYNSVCLVSRAIRGTCRARRAVPSGGAAAALASRTAWVAQGSDLAGSLRTPSAFCGVVGLRPTPGRVSYGPGANPYDTLGIHGPMARNVTDTALLLDAMCGEVDGAPLSLREPATSFLDHARKAQRRRARRSAKGSASRKTSRRFSPFAAGQWTG